jgi:uncharacterized protein
MKYLLLILISLQLFAQNEKPKLSQGAYFTEQQAVEFHKDLANQYNNKSEWEIRAELIRKGILEGAELINLPKRPNSKPIYSKVIKLNGYSVQNVAFETIEGYFLTGNIYRPLKYKGKLAGILCPHGHGKELNNRLLEYTQNRCATLARMGAIVFAYDMIGYGDATQCEHKIEKAFKLQTINGIRALDFLLEQPKIDPNRIGMTGESGGGTQTFMLTALDKRIKVAVPTVMVSGYFFGGCVCESGMPVHIRPTHQTTNVEIAALAAPRPMLLISDGGDWTKNNPELEYPFIKRIYGFYGVENLVENKHFPDEKHDFGPNKRQVAYQFLAKYLNLDIDSISKNGVVDESQNTILSADKLRVFNENIKRPDNAVIGNEEVMNLLK